MGGRASRGHRGLVGAIRICGGDWSHRGQAKSMGGIGGAIGIHRVIGGKADTARGIREVSRVYRGREGL